MWQPQLLSRSAPFVGIPGHGRDQSYIAYIITDDERLVACVRDVISGTAIQMKWFQSASGYLGYNRPVVASCLLISRRTSNMSGLDVQRKLGPRICPPIIFLSDDENLSLCVRAIKEGAHDFLKIPLITSQLRNAMEAAFNKDRTAILMRQKDEDLLRRWRSLTNREAEVMRYVAGGLLNKQTAAELGIAENTVQVHRGRVMRKMCADSFAALVQMSLRLADCGEYSHLHAVADPSEETLAN
jgi:FixJ family two-component response regulator